MGLWTDDEHGSSIKVLTWNIERGHALPRIIDELRRIDADILLLQARRRHRINQHRRRHQSINHDVVAFLLTFPYHYRHALNVIHIARHHLTRHHHHNGVQEVDVNCERTGNVDVGADIAQALGMAAYVFVCEFEELASPLRSPDMQGVPA